MIDNSYKLTIDLNIDTGEIDASGGGGGSQQQQKNKTIKTIAQVWSSLSFARQVFNQAASRVQTITGNADLQQKVSFWSNAAQQGIGTALAFGLGGPLAGGGALLGIGINYGFQAYDMSKNRQIAMIETNQARMRAGPSGNRSRLQ